METLSIAILFYFFVFGGANQYDTTVYVWRKSSTVVKIDETKHITKRELTTWNNNNSMWKKHILNKTKEKKIKDKIADETSKGFTRNEFQTEQKPCTIEFWS